MKAPAQPQKAVRKKAAAHAAASANNRRRPLSIYAENIVVYNSPPLILGFGGLLCVWFGIRRLRAYVIIGQIFVKSCKRRFFDIAIRPPRAVT